MFGGQEGYIEHLEGKLSEMRDRKDAAYLERNRVVALLARLLPSVRTKTDIPGWAENWHGCVFLKLPTGEQLSWHYRDDHAHLFEGLPFVESVEYDGHTTEQKYATIEFFCGEIDALMKASATARERFNTLNGIPNNPLF